MATYFYIENNKFNILINLNIKSNLFEIFYWQSHIISEWLTLLKSWLYDYFSLDLYVHKQILQLSLNWTEITDLDFWHFTSFLTFLIPKRRLYPLRVYDEKNYSHLFIIKFLLKNSFFPSNNCKKLLKLFIE